MRILHKPYRIPLSIACGVIAASTLSLSARADEPSRLGRLFRIGGSGSGSSTSSATASSIRPVTSNPPAGTPSPLPNASTPAPSTPAYGTSTPGPRIAPQPRNVKPATEADPIVTRISLGRSDNGSQFGMFMHVFADGTVIDSEGVHKVGQDALKPVLEALKMGELYRQKGHCGGPPTDFVEQVHMVVYERAYGKLRATSFSYSGNTHGCDPSVKHIHAALDGLQVKLASPPTTRTTMAPAPMRATAGVGPVMGLSPAR